MTNNGLVSWKDLEDVITRKSGYKDKLHAIVQNPQPALRLLGEAAGPGTLTIRGMADALEDIIGSIPDAETAREMLAQNVHEDRLTEMLQARGDLPSTVAYVADLDDVLAAIVFELKLDSLNHSRATRTSAVPLPPSERREDADEDREASAMEDRDAEDLDNDEDDEDDDEDEDGFRSEIVLPPIDLYILRAWAVKIMDRSDYPEFLQKELAGLTIYQHLLLQIWLDAVAEGTTDPHAIPPAAFDEVGIDPLEGQERLTALLDTLDELPAVTKDDLESARIELSARRKRAANAPKLQSEARDLAAEETKKAESLL